MSKRAMVVLLMTLVSVTGASAQVDGQPGSASRFIRGLGDQAIQVLRTPGMTLEQREARFRGLLRDGFDIDFIGRFVLGNSWRQATAEQQQDYQQLFGEYLLQTYSARLGGYAGETVTIVAEQAAGSKDVVVRTRIDRPSGPPIQADWRVRAADNPMKIIDIMVEGVSMAMTHRSEFASLVKNQGLDGLIEMLRARVDKLPATAMAR